MAKRHKHYNQRRPRKVSTRRQSSKVKKNDKNNRTESCKPTKDSYNTDELLLGENDLLSSDLILDYYFKHDLRNNSMHMGVFRPGKPRHNSSNKTSKIPPRYRPVKFIKAKTVYDPSANLLKLVIKSKESIGNDTLESEEKTTNISMTEVKKDITECTLDSNINISDDSSENNDLKCDRLLSITMTESPPGNTINKKVYNSITSSPHPFSNYVTNVLNQFNDLELETDNESSINLTCNYSYQDNISFSSSLQEYTEDLCFKDTNIDKDLDNCREEKDGNHDSIPNSEHNSLLEPEFGFLEEDFVADTSQINVSNIRLGALTNSYFVSCYKYFGNYDFKWIDHDIMIDVLLDIGLPEHRFTAYLEHVKNSLIPKIEEPDPTYSDIYFSETETEFTESEEVEFALDEDLLEGLDDLILYNIKYSKDRNQEFETKSLSTLSKNKGIHFLSDNSLDLENNTIQMLQDKLRKRQYSKTKGKKDKEEYIDMKNKDSTDLFKKYPYGFHVENIKNEFKLFLDSDRLTLIFPPFNPHGNQTIRKFAQYYNMTTTIIGKKGKTHVKVDKCKKTKTNAPNYNLINRIVKQRRVFMRIDSPKLCRDNELLKKQSGKPKFHVTEGEIIGEDAPEISKDNIGRKILEKLGWTSGQGLGVHNNKGISEPVMAKAKINKSGLRYHKS